ncbi:MULTISPECIES: ABC transporter ATP-binding protein [unclassified Paracoccus (in: a-proteobacteria)]|uniref:ABC transporter ATP-binding protein n=1 Tax=unclassified Paracoccus (in: a-proteobacteria) TaxID=2688777 RepID=UPI001600CDA7|nr:MULTISPECIES: ABC transporter ATP-binding protein [unclassified Paracoccus (in: a-proteobacteria)]MBB1492163.1 ABC transporter ATP-binding protein [Paracoccus sp. MC1854]MBB1498581.1 ABC transporter ATP-binding protein [Paracoccus sp. MC1862]QQO44164.1 ABC transporter ATP-binding protein [Paracoccus sp. MC1862]
MSDATVILDGVRKSYGGREVVHDLTYRLSPGEVVALVGHNGAGKTTQIKMMLGLVRPDGGLLQVLGADPAHGRHARSALGYLPESVQFHPSFTARETLGFYARLKGLPARGHDALFARVGLADAANRPVRGYSKGMRQRLGLAQAILGHPRLLLLDEPTSGLDPALRRELYGIVADLAREGTTVLLSSHALTELEDQAARVLVMNRGHLIADGTMEELRRLAGLPSLLRFRAEGAPAGAARIGDQWQVELSEAEKPAALRAALDAGARDITLEDPSLDDIYAHFLRREAA